MKTFQLLGATALAFNLAAAAPAWAAGYPERPVTIVVPYAPGGATDASARIVAQALEKQTGGTFIIDNAPGAGTTIGAAKVARAAPDGYTLLWGGLSSHAMAPNLYPRLPFDPVESFEPVSMTASSPYVLAVNAKSPYRSIADLVAKAKAEPGKLNYGTPGQGSSPHLTTELFLDAAGINVQNIPFKGAAPAMTSMLSGDIDFMIDTLTLPVQMIKAGKARALAVTSAKRVPELPDVPTMKESGLNVEAATWFGLFAPKGTPAEIVATLNKAVNAVLKDPAVISRMNQAGFDATPSSAAELAKTVKSENQKWGNIIKAKNIRLQ